MFRRFHVEMVNFVQDIEFSDGIKPKLEIKEELIDVKSRFEHTEPKLKVNDNMLKARSSEFLKWNKDLT